MKVLISNFSCILAITFSHWQRSISFLFGFRFCATRWVADKMVAIRAIDIWPNFVTRIKDWEGQCKSNRVNNKSYEKLVGHYQNLFCSTENGVFQVHCKHVAEFLDIISCWETFRGFPVQCPWKADEKAVLNSAERQYLKWSYNSLLTATRWHWKEGKSV